MKSSAVLAALLFAISPGSATTLAVVQVYEPLSLHDTDVDDVIAGIDETLKATVVPRPMALSKALPEALISSIRTPHRLPSDDPNYKITEANLLVLCNIGIRGELTSASQLVVKLDVSHLAIPHEVDLTSRQLLKLSILSVRKTLETYQRSQPHGRPLDVTIEIIGTNDSQTALRELNTKLSIPAGPDAR